MEKELSGMPKEQKVIGDLRDRVEGLSPDPEGFIAPEDKAKLLGLSSRQDNLKERTGGFEGEAGDAGPALPGHGHGDPEDLKEATGSMGEASGKLKRRRCPGAIPPGARGHPED